MSLPNSFCSGRRARTIQRYCCTRISLWEIPRFGWESCFPPGSILKWRSPSMILSAIGRSSSAMAGLMPGYVACHYAARTLWHLGYPDQALRAGR